MEDLPGWTWTSPEAVGWDRMDDNKVWSGFSMTARRNVARAIATVLGALVVLVAVLQGTALACRA